MMTPEKAWASESVSREPKAWETGEPVLNLDAIRELERKLEADGTSLGELMERAGESVATEIKKHFAHGTKTVLLCGKGNNGGDAWVVAADLAEAGFEVTVISASAPGDIQAEPARSAAIAALDQLAAAKPPSEIHILPSRESLEEVLADAEVVVDGILGTGFAGTSVHEPYATWITLANERRASTKAVRTFAIDAPSGLSAQTGTAADPTIQADCTITMLAMKPGLLTEAAKPYCGTLLCAHIADIASA